MRIATDRIEAESFSARWTHSAVIARTTTGFNGGDNSPSLRQFQNYIASGQIHYFIVDNGPGGRRGRGGESGSGTQITEWVQRNFTARNIGGTDVYDLTAGH